MKVLKDPDQVLQIMNRKLDELRKKFDEAEEEGTEEIRKEPRQGRGSGG